jgi:hypothetical protein
VADPPHDGFASTNGAIAGPPVSSAPIAGRDLVYEQQDGPHVATGADILLRAAAQRRRSADRVRPGR